jgi:hypothetical protein
VWVGMIVGSVGVVGDGFRLGDFESLRFGLGLV